VYNNGISSSWQSFFYLSMYSLNFNKNFCYIFVYDFVIGCVMKKLNFFLSLNFWLANQYTVNKFICHDLFGPGGIYGLYLCIKHVTLVITIQSRRGRRVTGNLLDTQSGVTVKNRSRHHILLPNGSRSGH